MWLRTRVDFPLMTLVALPDDHRFEWLSAPMWFHEIMQAAVTLIVLEACLYVLLSHSKDARLRTWAIGIIAQCSASGSEGHETPPWQSGLTDQTVSAYSSDLNPPTGTLLQFESDVGVEPTTGWVFRPPPAPPPSASAHRPERPANLIRTANLIPLPTQHLRRRPSRRPSG
jgi:hypothetical protein